jgi:nucleoid-associated protein YgaU
MNISRIVLVAGIGCALCVQPTFAQQQPVTVDPNKPDEQLLQKEADVRIKQFKETVSGLEAQLKQLNDKPVQLRAELARIQQQTAACDSTLYALIGASKADVERFRERLGALAAKVREMKQLSDDQLIERQDQVAALEKELNELRKDKIAILPEFYPKIIALAQDIKSLYREKKVKNYTVGTWSENRECLWNIASREEIYNDAFLWPKIWVANRSIIRNPDIIYPGQQLTIPVKADKTDEEMKAERRYWRQKREAAAATTTTPSSSVPQQQPIKTNTVNN